MHTPRRLTLLSGCLVLFVYLTVIYTIGILSLTENQRARFRRSEGCSDVPDDDCGPDYTVWPPPPDPHNDTGGEQEGDKKKKRCDAEVEYLLCQMCGNRWCDDAKEKAIMDEMKDEISGKSWRKQCCTEEGCTDNDLKNAFCNH